MHHASVTPLIKLAELSLSEMEKVSALIQDVSSIKHSDLVAQIVKYILSSGGKHIRPLLTISSAKIFGYHGDHHILLAAAVECIHTATLLHDDVIDQSLLRRGAKTANALWGNQAAVLVGDYLFSQAFKFMVKTEIIEALSILANASSIISEAEVLQLQLIDNIELSEESYYQLISAKTAELFAAACKVGAVAAGATQEQLQALYEYGIKFGLVFQIIDDMLDYYGQHNEFGKETGGDFFEGKITLPLIVLYKHATEEDKIAIRACFAEGYVRQERDLANIINLLVQYNCREVVLQTATNIAEQGVELIKKLPLSAFSQLMIESLQRSVDRTF